MDIQKINIDKVAAAIEADAGVALPGLRESLAEAKAGIYGPCRSGQTGQSDQAAQH